MSEEAVATRATALRAGPWRAAVLTDDRSPGAAMASAIDRFIPRGASRACPTGAPRTLPAPGTYAASAPSSEAYLAFPIEASALPAAPFLVAALDGKDGLLEKALSGVVRDASARLLGVPRAPAVVAFLDAPGGALDAAVMQTRTLFDRVRKSGLTPEELSRARRTQGASDLHARLDPHERLIRLWRNASAASPDDAAIQAAAGAVFRDEALVVVAARPPSSGTGAKP
jgi:hypothetical protein